MQETLLEQKSRIEREFELKKAEKAQLQDQMSEIDTELVKLQGEFRLCSELIENLDKSEAAEPVEGEVIDANTITVQEPEE